MTSIIKLNVMSGAMDESPPCYILQIDDVRILLDCGWDEQFDQDFIREISKQVKYVDLVLLTYPDQGHLGALPYLVGKCGLSCPIYATIPVYKMGQMFMYDLYQSRYNNEDFKIFNLDDVDAAFDKIIQLKYNQTVALKGKCHGLSIVPIPAGHIIGGTIWKIMKTEEEDIVYAVDFNHKKERHLNGCNFEKIQRPLLLITNSFNGIFHQERRRVRDEKLMTNILQTFSNNGNVLIAIDTAGRVLELAHMLDQLWGNKNSGLQSHSLCFLNNVSYNVIEFAKSQIEWMSDKLMKTFESARYNPFQFKYIKPCHSLADIHKISGSKVVLASMHDLECGYARSLCLDWLSDSANSIILTTTCRKGTLARELIDLPQSQKNIHVTVKRREKLIGEELANYRKTYQQKSDTDSSDSDDIQVIGNIMKNHDFVVKVEKNKQKKNRYSISRSYPIYPSQDIKKKYDEYGEIIVLSDYMKENKEHEKGEEKLEEEVLDIIECPTKCVAHEKKLEIRASIQFISFEGRSDGESLQKLIANSHPRTVILVKAPASETEMLANYLREKTNAIVFTPSKGEVIDATTEAHIYQIRLTDGLASSLDMQQGDNVHVELAWVDALAATYTRPYNVNLKDKEEEDMEMNDSNNNLEEDCSISKDDHDDLMVLEPVVNKSEITPHSTIFINEIKLSDLKHVINRCGIDCEFSGGVLFCSNRTIAIRRDGKRKITFEGVLSEDYYKVRTLLYGHYAIL